MNDSKSPLRLSKSSDFLRPSDENPIVNAEDSSTNQTKSVSENKISSIIAEVASVCSDCSMNAIKSPLRLPKSSDFLRINRNLTFDSAAGSELIYEIYLRLARGWTFKAREFCSTCRAPKLLDLDPNHIAICVLCDNTWMTIREGTAI